MFFEKTMPSFFPAIESMKKNAIVVMIPIHCRRLKCSLKIMIAPISVQMGLVDRTGASIVMGRCFNPLKESTQLETTRNVFIIIRKCSCGDILGT